jgi:hypothetical protein
MKRVCVESTVRIVYSYHVLRRVVFLIDATRPSTQHYPAMQLSLRWRPASTRVLARNVINNPCCASTAWLVPKCTANVSFIVALRIAQVSPERNSASAPPKRLFIASWRPESELDLIRVRVEKALCTVQSSKARASKSAHLRTMFTLPSFFCLSMNCLISSRSSISSSSWSACAFLGGVEFDGGSGCAGEAS